MPNEVPQHVSQVPFVDHDDVVQTLPRIVPTKRSAVAFAFGVEIGVSTVLTPIALARAMKSPRRHDLGHG